MMASETSIANYPYSACQLVLEHADGSDIYADQMWQVPHEGAQSGDAQVGAELFWRV